MVDDHIERVNFLRDEFAHPVQVILKGKIGFEIPSNGFPPSAAMRAV
jgi:hypothetical protein